MCTGFFVNSLYTHVCNLLFSDLYTALFLYSKSLLVIFPLRELKILLISCTHYCFPYVLRVLKCVQDFFNPTHTLSEKVCFPVVLQVLKCVQDFIPYPVHI